MQVSRTFKKKIVEPCMKVTSKSSKALKMLASSIKLMTDPSPANLDIKNSKAAVRDLKILCKLTPLFEDADTDSTVLVAAIASTLIQVVQCIEEISKSVHAFSRSAHFESPMKLILSPEKTVHRESKTPNVDGVGGNHVVVVVHDDEFETVIAIMDGGKSNHVIVLVHDGESKAKDFFENTMVK